MENETLIGIAGLIVGFFIGYLIRGIELEYQIRAMIKKG